MKTKNSVLTAIRFGSSETNSETAQSDKTKKNNKRSVSIDELIERKNKRKRLLRNFLKFLTFGIYGTPFIKILLMCDNIANVFVIFGLLTTVGFGVYFVVSENPVMVICSGIFSVILTHVMNSGTKGNAP